MSDRYLHWTGKQNTEKQCFLQPQRSHFTALKTTHDLLAS